MRTAWSVYKNNKPFEETMGLTRNHRTRMTPLAPAGPPLCPHSCFAKILLIILYFRESINFRRTILA